MSAFIYNVGEIVLRDDERFWIFPINYLNGFNIRSPWFTYEEENWYLVKVKEDSLFRLWKKNISNLSKHEYTMHLILENEACWGCSGIGFFNPNYTVHANTNSDYGCELQLPKTGPCGNKHDPITQNGLVKLFFEIDKKANINIAYLRYEENLSYAESSEDENDILGIVFQTTGYEDNLSYAESSEDERNDMKENVSESKGVDRLVRDLKSLLSNGQRSDVTLKVGDREFHVHRNILIVRSPVFASMLQHDTKENATGVVDIPDCSAEAFEDFLSYIYTGSIDTMSSDNIFHLYYAADKYQVNDLKSECVEYMERNLSVENFCAVMTLSLQHSESGLQRKATSFFCDNVKVIIKTVQWQKYVKDFPTEANELYIKAMNA